jgi:hypothetical protein
MARKTLRMALVAYNLIKSSCQEAGHAAGQDLRLMSFKGALDTIVANTARYLRRQKHVRKIQEIWASMIEMIAEKVIDLRPFRQEPRAQKKRPKPSASSPLRERNTKKSRIAEEPELWLNAVPLIAPAKPVRSKE